MTEVGRDLPKRGAAEGHSVARALRKVDSILALELPNRPSIVVSESGPFRLKFHSKVRSFHSEFKTKPDDMTLLGLMRSGAARWRVVGSFDASERLLFCYK